VKNEKIAAGAGFTEKDSGVVSGGAGWGSAR
jgi:hypothetical protein